MLGAPSSLRLTGGGVFHGGTACAALAAPGEGTLGRAGAGAGTGACAGAGGGTGVGPAS